MLIPRLFLECYYEITNIDLAIAIKKFAKVPRNLAKEKLNINEFKDGEIIHQPYGVVFQGKNKKGTLTKFLFQITDLERYTTSHYTNILI